MVTTVLADCPLCQREVEAKLLDCDKCFEEFLAKGGEPNDWDELNCDHIACMICGEPLS